LAATETPDSASVTGAIWQTAQIVSIDGSDTVTATAENWTAAQIAANDNGDVASIAGIGGSTATSAVIAATDGSDSASIGTAVGLPNLTPARVISPTPINRTARATRPLIDPEIALGSRIVRPARRLP
jgi:hypothetical protein